jgi:hypothetical protein
MSCWARLHGSLSFVFHIAPFLHACCWKPARRVKIRTALSCGASGEHSNKAHTGHRHTEDWGMSAIIASRADFMRTVQHVGRLVPVVSIKCDQET